MAPFRARSIWGVLLPAALLFSVSACELDEVTLAEPQDIPVAEVYIMVGDGQDQVYALLHWTLGTRPVRDLEELGVTLIREDGMEVNLFPGDLTDCLMPGSAEKAEGACYTPGIDPEGVFQPGTRVELEILLEDDQLLRGATEIPEAIEFLNPVARNQCALPPGKELEFVWSRSPGVWAYSAETEIRDLRRALGQAGIPVETDSVALLGFAVSDSDTTIVFPKEFGVFDRFDLEQEVALALQEGLPRGAMAEVAVAALDHNYVNWVRGGSFNPSGPVRVSSLRGPGVGVFGSVFRRTILVKGGDPHYFPGSVLPDCLSLPHP